MVKTKEEYDNIGNVPIFSVPFQKTFFFAFVALPWMSTAVPTGTRVPPLNCTAVICLMGSLRVASKFDLVFFLTGPLYL